MLPKHTLSAVGILHGFYVDYGGVFSVNLNNPEREKKTQWERAVASLGKQDIHACSPKAKGRVERPNGTLQDHLPKELRLADISSIEVLYLCFNQLADLPADFNPPLLRYLDLGDNRLAALSANFSPPLLEDLNLDSNQLADLPADFSPPLLQYLNLNNNRFAAIPAGLELPELRRLELSNNNIQEFNPTRLLEQFPKLERIYLSNNTELHQENIQELRDLALVANRENPLTIIAENIRPEGDDIKG